ncbi:MAG: hypothetical protein KH009_07530, partial [Clostridiales bacterium]|nr:hypothetical protein [Clostridiales bacterium]
MLHLGAFSPESFPQCAKPEAEIPPKTDEFSSQFRPKSPQNRIKRRKIRPKPAVSSVKTRKITEKLQKHLKKVLTRCGGGYNGITSAGSLSTGEAVESSGNCEQRKFFRRKTNMKKIFALALAAV